MPSPRLRSLDRVTRVPSGALTFVVWYLRLDALLVAVLFTVGITMLLVAPDRPGAGVIALGALARGAQVALLLWTARLVERRARLGGVLALALAALPLVAWAAGAPVDWGTLAFAVIGTVLVAVVWRELDGRPDPA